MPRPIALAALAAILVSCGMAGAFAQGAAGAQGDGPASASGPTAGPTDPAPSASAAPASETALSPDSTAAQPVPGDAPAAGAPASPKPAPSATPQPGSMVLREGDVIAGRSQDGKVRVMKILKINYVEGDRLLHAIAYTETFRSWEEAAAAQRAKSMTVMIAHLPIDGEGLTPDANRVLANEPVTDSEMQGYRDYLKEVGP